MSDAIEALLTEIRDLQQKQVQALEIISEVNRVESERARENQERAIALQEQASQLARANQEKAIRIQEEAVARQKVFGALYRRVLLIIAIVVAGLIFWLYQITSSME